MGRRRIIVGSLLMLLVAAPHSSAQTDAAAADVQNLMQELRSLDEKIGQLEEERNTLFQKILAIHNRAGLPKKERHRIEFRRAFKEPLVMMRTRGNLTPMWVHRVTEITNRHIESASVAQDARGKPTISILFTQEGANRMWELSGDQIGQQIAIIIDGELVSAPTVNMRVKNEVVITSGEDGFTKDEAQQIVDSLNPHVN